MTIASRVLLAAEIEGEFLVSVHLDTAKVVPPEGVAPQLSQERTPDPEWCVLYRFPVGPDPDVQVADALLQAKQALLAKLKALGRPLPHPIDGQLVNLLALRGEVKARDEGLSSPGENGSPDSTGDRTAAGMPGKGE